MFFQSKFYILNVQLGLLKVSNLLIKVGIYCVKNCEKVSNLLNLKPPTFNDQNMDSFKLLNCKVLHNFFISQVKVNFRNFKIFK